MTTGLRHAVLRPSSPARAWVVETSEPVAVGVGGYPVTIAMAWLPDGSPVVLSGGPAVFTNDGRARLELFAREPVLLGGIGIAFLPRDRTEEVTPHG